MDEFVNSSIIEAKERIKQSISKDVIIIFFTRLLEDLKKNPNSDVFGRVMEIYYFFKPYKKANKTEIYDFFTSKLDQSEGLILDEYEKKYFQIIFSEINPNYKFKNGQIMKGRIKGMLDKITLKYLPNTSKITNSYIIGKLICSMGGLANLVIKPSSTIQLIGSEKSLFRHKRINSKPPKYGLLYYTEEVQKSKNKGKTARQIANKLSIAIKQDYYHNFAR